VQAFSEAGEFGEQAGEEAESGDGWPGGMACLAAGRRRQNLCLA
jgi:hypothetical protein